METQHNAFLNSASRFWKLSKTLPMRRVGNSTQRFPELSVSLLETQQNTPYETRWKLNTTLS
ncbi:hypothetical protein MAL08_01805 [Leptospira noguchii]|uniref:hypothetical protein n=1 Tax=Leptospira noguchii TaxID=28182 RepID=UPI001FB6482D|nr:hypothetical protein [Leptospira noguchii]UOG38126.1 hypothetical protein MAL08_01800 [Leptospira noguchii]UOG38127.1 hypothetical protein MAL08_01805 [Leptospira noguchii]